MSEAVKMFNSYLLKSFFDFSGFYFSSRAQRVCVSRREDVVGDRVLDVVAAAQGQQLRPDVLADENLAADCRNSSKGWRLGRGRALR